MRTFPSALYASTHATNHEKRRALLTKSNHVKEPRLALGERDPLPSYSTNGPVGEEEMK
jgi:hypothetical protein